MFLGRHAGGLGISRGRDQATGPHYNHISTTRTLTKLLVTAILKAPGEVASRCRKMDDLESDTASLALEKLLSSCAMDLGLTSSSAPASLSRDVAG